MVMVGYYWFGLFFGFIGVVTCIGIVVVAFRWWQESMRDLEWETKEWRRSYDVQMNRNEKLSSECAGWKDENERLIRQVGALTVQLKEMEEKRDYWEQRWGDMQKVGADWQETATKLNAQVESLKANLKQANKTTESVSAHSAGWRKRSQEWEKEAEDRRAEINRLEDMIKQQHDMSMKQCDNIQRHVLFIRDMEEQIDAFVTNGDHHKESKT